MLKTLLILILGTLSLQGVCQKPFFDLLLSLHQPIDGNEVNMIPYRDGDLYGFSQPYKPENILIKPIYNAVHTVHSEGAIVDKGDGFGLVNSENKIIIPFRYGSLKKDGDFYHGVNYGDKEDDYKYSHYFYNLKGELIFSQKSRNDVDYGFNSYAWFDYQDAIIIKDKNGSAVSRFTKVKRQFCLGIYDDYTCFRTQKNDTTVYSTYRHDGDLVAELPIAHMAWSLGVLPLDEGFFLLISSQNNSKFSSKSGEVKPYRARLSRFEIEESTSMKRGTIRVGDSKAGVMGVINLKGDTIIPFQYSKIFTKVNNRYIAIEKETQQMVVLDAAGQKLSEFDPGIMDFIQQRKVLDEPVAFFENLAIARRPILKGDSLADVYNVKDSTVYYFTFFNPKGETIIRLNPKYTFVGNFSDGLAAVADTAGNLGFINKKGEWVIEPLFKLEVPKYGFDANEIPKFKGGFAYIRSAKGYIDKNGQRYFKN